MLSEGGNNKKCINSVSCYCLFLFSVILSGENAIGADKSEGTRAVKMIKRYFYVVTNKNLDYARCRKEKIVARDREIFTNENVTNGERL